MRVINEQNHQQKLLLFVNMREAMNRIVCDTTEKSGFVTYAFQSLYERRAHATKHHKW